MIQVSASPAHKGCRLEAVQLLPVEREQVFAFFADAFQLEVLTPPWLRFAVLTPPPIELAAGTHIDYRLRLHGIPVRWQSRISVWEPPFRFVDEQVRGPYRHWRHEHVFEVASEGGGTVCRDIVDYAVPGGRVVHALFVRRDVVKIFQYRQRKLDELFSIHGQSPRDLTNSLTPSSPGTSPAAPGPSTDQTATGTAARDGSPSP